MFDANLNRVRYAGSMMKARFRMASGSAALRCFRADFEPSAAETGVLLTSAKVPYPLP